MKIFVHVYNRILMPNFVSMLCLFPDLSEAQWRNHLSAKSVSAKTLDGKFFVHVGTSFCS